jgi:hypothetical protein
MTSPQRGFPTKKNPEKTSVFPASTKSVILIMGRENYYRKGFFFVADRKASATKSVILIMGQKNFPCGSFFQGKFSQGNLKRLR